MRKAILLLACVTLYLFAGAAHSAYDRGFFWQVESHSAIAWLLGSIHFADSSVYPMRPVIEQNFAAADALVVELDVLSIDTQVMQRYIQQHGMYPEGESLRQHLSAQTWRQMQHSLQQLGVPLALVENKKPGLLVMDITTLLLARLGYSALDGIDLHFLVQARRMQKPVLALETLEQQLDLFIRMPAGDVLLQQTLDHSAQAGEEMQNMLSTWKRGDETALYDMMVEKPEQAYSGYAEVNEALLFRRNDTMVQKIKKLMMTGKRYFIVVGAGHLIGQRCIVQQLKQAGFKVQRL